MTISMAMVSTTMEGIFGAVMKMILEESWFHHTMNRAFGVVDNMSGSTLDAWIPLYDELYTSD